MQLITFFQLKNNIHFICALKNIITKENYVVQCSTCSSHLTDGKFCNKHVNFHTCRKLSTYTYCFSPLLVDWVPKPNFLFINASLIVKDGYFWFWNSRAEGSLYYPKFQIRNYYSILTCGMWWFSRPLFSQNQQHPITRSAHYSVLLMDRGSLIPFWPGLVLGILATKPFFH